jgi:hypothetical protein
VHLGGFAGPIHAFESNKDAGRFHVKPYCSVEAAGDSAQRAAGRWVR